MHDAFISYRRRNNGTAVAKMLRELLKTKGIHAYMDLDELHSGTFNDKLADAIRSAPCFLLVLAPGSLDDCGQPDDWLTREILVALDPDRHIVPVLCDGFEWPRVWDSSIPEQLHRLSNINSVIFSYFYFDASLDKIIRFMSEAGVKPAFASASPADPFHADAPVADRDIDLFFRSHMRDLAAIETVDLAFHAGSVWHENIDRLEIITTLAEAGVKMRVLVNSPEAANVLGQHMRYRLKKYTPYEESVELWKNFQSLYDSVEVRVCELPMLRIYYSFHMKNEANDATRVKYYTYGNGRINSNFSQNFTAGDPYFSLYRSEFEYLWERSAP